MLPRPGPRTTRHLQGPPVVRRWPPSPTRSSSICARSGRASSSCSRGSARATSWTWASAGANYGYALMWVFVVAILFRFLFVSLIARYQLCNQHGEGVLDGLARLHPLYAPVLFCRGDRDGPRLRVVHDRGRRRGVPERVRRSAPSGSGRRLCNARRAATWCSGRASACSRFGLHVLPRGARRSRSSARRSGSASIRPRSRAGCSGWRCPAGTAPSTRRWSRSR